MASIFDNYDNLSNEYIPSNMNKPPKPPKANPYFDPAAPKLPYCDYNAEGDITGYWWPYGNTVNLEFNLDGCVTVEGSKNFITVRNFIKNKQIKVTIYNFRHEVIDTMLFDGNDYQSYIKVDNITSESSGLFYIYDEENKEYIAVTLPPYQEGQTYYVENPENPSVIYPIDVDKSLLFEKGTYYCSLSILDKNLHDTILPQDMCTLTVR